MDLISNLDVQRCSSSNRSCLRKRGRKVSRPRRFLGEPPLCSSSLQYFPVTVQRKPIRRPLIDPSGLAVPISTPSNSSSSSSPADTKPIEHDAIPMVDDLGRVTPEAGRLISRMTMEDIARLLLNIQKLIAKSPGTARKTLTDCVELSEAVLHAQLLTGMLNSQIHRFSGLPLEETNAAEVLRRRRMEIQNGMCNDLLTAADASSSSSSSSTSSFLIEGGYPSGVTEGEESGSEERSLKVARKTDVKLSSALLALADEVTGNPEMLDKILNVTTAEIEAFPSEDQQTKVRGVRQILQQRGYYLRK